MAINVCEVFEYNQHFVAMMNVINAARLNPPESGHNHTEETRKKISNSRKGKCKGMSWKIVEGHRVWYKKEVL